MARFLISTMPAIGHVNPFLLTAKTLVERGHEVWWHTGIEVCEKVEAMGASFVPMVHTPNILQSMVEAQQKDGLAAANASMITLFVTPMLGQLQDYEEILSEFRADAVLVDMCSLGAELLNEKGGPVWASVGINPIRTEDSPLYGSRQMPAQSGFGRLRNRVLNKLSEMFLSEVTRTFNRQRLQVGLSSIPQFKTVFDYLKSPYLHLQGTTPAFEFPHRNLPGQIHYVGPMLPPMPDHFQMSSWWSEMKSGRPVVHVTQGTIATEITELVLPTVEAVRDENMLLIVTTPEPEKLGDLPSNVHVEKMIPHSLLLPHVDVMVTNGGYNGVKVALSFGVPLVAAGDSEDKPEVGSRIAWSGVGIVLKTGSPEPSQLKAAIREVLSKPAYRERAMAVQTDFALHDSPVEAAKLLEQLVQTKKPVLREV